MLFFPWHSTHPMMLRTSVPATGVQTRYVSLTPSHHNSDANFGETNKRANGRKVLRALVQKEDGRQAQR